jgi:hypothetical protein
MDSGKELKRNTLFRSRDLALFTGTYNDRSSIIYDEMINAFKNLPHIAVIRYRFCQNQLTFPLAI